MPDSYDMRQVVTAQTWAKLQHLAQARGQTPETVLLDLLLDAEHSPQTPALPSLHMQEASEILERITDAFFALDVDFRFTYLNQQAEHLLECDRAQLLGRVVWDVFPEARGSEFQQQYEHALQTQTTVTFEAYYAPMQIWFEVNAYPSADGLSVFFRDISEQMRVAQNLLRSQQDLRVLIEHNPDFISRYDADLRRTYVNPILAEYLGWPREELVGLTLSEMRYPAEFAARLEAIMRRVLHTGVPERVEYEGVLGLEGCFYESHIVPEPDLHGDIASLLVITRDITDRYQIEQERANCQRLELQIERDQELASIRERLMSVISHEFRTPLATISSYAQMLLHYGERLDKEQRERRLRGIQDHVNDMTQMLQDVVALYREQMLNRRVEFQQQDMVALVTGIIEDFRLMDIGQHRITMQTQGEPCPVAIERMSINNAMRNIIHNALKYSPPHTPIEVRLHFHTEQVHFSVQDQGIGIPQEAQAHIFEPFYRATNAENIQGTGLGLVVARQSVELHGGSIHVESDGQGSTFSISLPYAPPPLAGTFSAVRAED